MAGRKIAPSDLAHVMPRGGNVFVQQGASEPQVLHRALLDVAHHCDPRLLVVPVAGVNACEFANGGNRFATNPVAFIGAPKLADGILAGRVDYLPSHWSEIVPTMLRRFPPDVVMVQVSPPDQEGYCNLGVSASLECDLLQAAGVVIAELNPRIPRVGGDTRIHTTRIDFYAETDNALLTSRPSVFGAVELEIAKNVSSVVKQGSTVQVGIGSVPDAVVNRLASDGKIAAFHSGILTDSMMRVAESLDGRARVVTAGMVVGSTELYARINESPRVSLRSSRHTHAQQVLASIDRFVAINSAIEVDLLGQVNAEFLNGRQVAGIGGQADFFRGAHGCAQGAAIIALPSTSNGKSRIVPRLAADTPVTTARVDVDYVVTEWGVAELRDRTVAERAIALVEVAAPEFRKELYESTTRMDH